MNLRLLPGALFFTLAAHASPLPDWALGPFVRPTNAQPIIRPNPASVFDCPMTGKPVRWEASHTFNPAAVAKDGKVYLLYRAEDQSGNRIGGYTSRLGLAVSDDGIRFKKAPQPVLYPADDAQKEREWAGGCEDPRLVELEDGRFVLLYTQYYRPPEGNRRVNVGLAISKDLVHWEKKGPVVARDDAGKTLLPRKSAALLTAVRDGRLVAKRIDGRYWLYVGEGGIDLLSSSDLKEWKVEARNLLPRRPGFFDSDFAECGPPAVLTAKGIVLLYNGKNTKDKNADPRLHPGIYSCGQALFDAADPRRLIARPDQPFFRPELSWEKTGQYGAGTTFIEGLVLFKNKWLLYYGCADTFVGVGIADSRPGETRPPAPR